MKMRERWPNKFVYIIAAIGAAAGLWNLWRFPMLAYEHWWWAFIFALLISNIFIVLPLVLLESVLWQKYQSCWPKIFQKIKAGSSWIQWLPIIAMIFIFMYYAPIMAWAEVYLVKSFSWWFLAEPVSYFANNIIWLSSSISIWWGLQWWILIALFVSFVFVFLSLWKWLKSVSNVLKFTVPIPFILLVILWIQWVGLPWGMEWLAVLFKPEWSALADINLWQAAIWQSFFSASLAFGYFMFASSHRWKNDELTKSSILILAWNFLASLLSGIAIFSTIWFMAKEQGKAFFDVITWWSQLIFSVLPTAISLMPFFKIGFAVLLFIVVITLALSSIFAFVEVIVWAFMEVWSKRISWLKSILVLLIFVFLGSIPYVFGAWSYYLQITDHFVGWYIFMLIWILESLLVWFVLWFWKTRNWINECSSIKFWRWLKRYFWFIPVVLIFIFVSALFQEWFKYQWFPFIYIFVFGIVPLILTFAISFFLSKKQK